MSREYSGCSNEGFAFFSKGDMIKNLTTVLAKLIIALLKLVYFRKVFGKILERSSRIRRVYLLIIKYNKYSSTVLKAKGSLVFEGYVIIRLYTDDYAKLYYVIP